MELLRDGSKPWWGLLLGIPLGAVAVLVNTYWGSTWAWALIGAAVTSIAFLVRPGLVAFVPAFHLLLKDLTFTTLSRPWGAIRSGLPTIPPWYSYSFLFGLTIVSLLLLRRRRHSGALSSSANLFGVYLLWCIFSSVYSVQPGLTLQTSFVILVAFLSGYLLVGQGDEQMRAKAWDVLYWSLAIDLVLNLSYALVNPSYALEPFKVFYRLHGLSSHANVLGNTSGVFVVLSVLRVDRNRVYLFPLALGMITLIATQSRTSLVAAIGLAGLALLVRSTSRKNYRWLVAVSILLCASFIALPFYRDALWDVFVRGEDLSSLTGRPAIWILAFAYWQLYKPWGSGFAALWENNLNEVFQSVYNTTFIPSGSHNSFIDILVETGYIGLALAVGTLLLVLREGLKVARLSSVAAEGVMVILFVLLTGLLESSFATGPRMSYLLFIHALLFVSAAYSSRVQTEGTT